MTVADELAALIEHFFDFPAADSFRGGDEFGIFGISVQSALAIDFSKFYVYTSFRINTS